MIIVTEGTKLHLNPGEAKRFRNFVLKRTLKHLLKGLKVSRLNLHKTYQYIVDKLSEDLDEYYDKFIDKILEYISKVYGCNLNKREFTKHLLKWISLHAIITFFSSIAKQIVLEMIAKKMSGGLSAEEFIDLLIRQNRREELGRLIRKYVLTSEVVVGVVLAAIYYIAYRNTEDDNELCSKALFNTIIALYQGIDRYIDVGKIDLAGTSHIVHAPLQIVLYRLYKKGKLTKKQYVAIAELSMLLALPYMPSPAKFKKRLEEA